VACYGIGTAQALRKWLPYRGRDDGPLFTTFLGGSITASGISQLFSRASKAAGVKVRPHMLRHSWADAMLQGRVRERDLMTLAGWSSTAMLKVNGELTVRTTLADAARGAHNDLPARHRPPGWSRKMEPAVLRTAVVQTLTCFDSADRRTWP
jgi:integrase